MPGQVVGGPRSIVDHAERALAHSIASYLIKSSMPRSIGCTGHPVSSSAALTCAGFGIGTHAVSFPELRTTINRWTAPTLPAQPLLHKRADPLPVRRFKV